jgi:hypothetical protein
VAKVGGDSPADAIYKVGGKIFAETYALGDKRTMDSLVLDTYVEFPNVWCHPAIHYESVLAVDPYPFQDDILDPILWEVVLPTDRSFRYGSLGLRLRPIYSETWKVDLFANTGATTYRAQEVTAESNLSTKMGSKVAYAATFRSQFSLGIVEVERNFFSSDDHRQDKMLTIEPGWRYFYTPNFSHSIAFGRENLASSRNDAAFTRSFGNFGISLVF